MDGIMPVKIVIGISSIPPSIMRLQSVVRPADACVRPGNDDGFSLEPKRPNIRSMSVLDTWLDGRRCAGYAGLQRRSVDRTSLGELIINLRITLNACYLGKGSQRVGDFSGALHPNEVHDIKGAILDVTIAQPLQDRLLRALRLFQQCLINETPFFGLCPQIGRRAEIGLVCQHD